MFAAPTPFNDCIAVLEKSLHILTYTHTYPYTRTYIHQGAEKGEKRTEMGETNGEQVYLWIVCVDCLCSLIF